MKTSKWINAGVSLRELFPDVDTDSAASRYYDALNTIAITVAEYRYANHLTQTALAEMLNVTQAMVSKYESGDYNISLKAAFELFDKLGMAFRCTIDDSAPVQVVDQTYQSSENPEAAVEALSNELAAGAA